MHVAAVLSAVGGVLGTAEFPTTALGYRRLLAWMRSFAARAVLSGEATATPKTHDGAVEALRALKVLQRSATKARTQAINQLRSLLVTASDELRAPLRDLPEHDRPRRRTTVCRYAPGGLAVVQVRSSAGAERALTSGAHVSFTRAVPVADLATWLAELLAGVQPPEPRPGSGAWVGALHGPLSVR